MKHRRPTVYMMDLLATVPYYTAYLSRALLQNGVDVTVGSITYYLDRECFRGRGLTLRPGCVDLVGRFASLPRVVRRAGKLLEAMINLVALSIRFSVRPPAVLHVQYLPMLRSSLPLDMWFMHFARWRGVCVVLTVHDLLPHDTADQYRAKFFRLYHGVDQIICHSVSVKIRLTEEFKVPEARISVIPHGPFFYDLTSSRKGTEAVRELYHISLEQQIVLWQGILFPYKGLDVLLDAWQTVEARFPHATLLVVGTGAAEVVAEVLQQAARLALQRVVFDLRFVSAEELVDVYRAAAIVVYPYRAITTSGALSTGIALGKAIVASDLPVFRELMTDSEDALLVSPGESHALAEALLRLLQSRPLQARLEAGVQAKDFGARSWRDIAEQTEAAYRAALARY